MRPWLPSQVQLGAKGTVPLSRIQLSCAHKTNDKGISFPMKPAKILILCVVVFFFSGRVVAANLIANGSFEEGDFSGVEFDNVGPGETVITSWEIGGAGVDWHTANPDPFDGNFGVDLNLGGGGLPDTGTLSQTFPTEAGEIYVLTFFFSGPGNFVGWPSPRQVNVDVAGVSQVFSVPSTSTESLVWEQKQLVFTATGPSETLMFSSVDGTGFWGPFLDSVSVEKSTGQIINGGFETGDLTGWTVVEETTGTVEVLDAANLVPGISAPEGTEFVLLSTHSPGDDDKGDDFDNGIIYQEFVLDAPDTLELTLIFLTDESLQDVAGDQFGIFVVDELPDTEDPELEDAEIVILGSVPGGNDPEFPGYGPLNGIPYQVVSPGATNGSTFGSGATVARSFAVDLDAGTHFLIAIIVDLEDDQGDSGIIVDNVRLRSQTTEVNVPGGDTGALEDALDQAAANPSVTTQINLGEGDFVVDKQLPEITSTVEITGSGFVTLTGPGKAKGGGVRMAQVEPTGTLILDSVVVQDFSDSAMEVLGSAQISNVLFGNNSNPGDTGGAINARDGELRVSNSLFFGNSATVGGAIYAENMGFAQPPGKVDRNPGPLRLEFNQFVDNTASIGGAHVNLGAFEFDFDDKVDRNPIATISNNTFANAFGDELIRLEGGGFELIDNSAVAGAGQTFVTSNDFNGQSDGDNRLQGNAIDGTGCDTGNASSGTPFVSDGYNVYGDNSCPSDGPGDQTSTDPQFADECPDDDDAVPCVPFGAVLPLDPDSPAIDAGLGINGKGVSTELPCDYKDIRGLARPQDGDGDGDVRCDIGAYEVQDGPDIGAAQSGPFFDSGRDGEGIFVEMLGGDLALVYVFTYTPDGSGQAWILGVGNVVGNSIVVDDIQITGGGIFGEDFDPDDVIRESWGGFSVSFPDCAGDKPGVMSFTGNETLGYESLITRASRIAAILGCPGQKQAFVNKTGIDSSYSGSWFDPGHDGEGFILEVLNATTVVVQWFTYDEEGNQFWIQGIGTIDGKTITVKEAFYTRGTSWGSGFDPDDVERVDWGTIVISFDGCDSATASYESLLAEFGSGTQNLQRITTLAGLSCD